MKHAKLSASGAHRWINCAGSVKAESNQPRGSSRFAMEGSAAHELAELCLTEGVKPFDMVGKTLEGYGDFPVDDEMAGSIQQYIDYINAIGADITMTEERVDFSDWVPEGFGTSDIIAIKGDTLHVVDLKYGKGIKVYAEDNPQGLLYALGAYAMLDLAYDIKHIVISIVQPRIDHIDEWTLTNEKLLAWGNWVSEKASLALTDDAPRTASEKACQWCSVKATCPALKKLTDDAVMGDFDNCDESPDTLTDEQLAFVLTHKKLIVSWFDAIESLIKERLDGGVGFHGYKLVAGRNSRSWVDAHDADTVLTDLLGDARHVVKLVTPAAAEKALGKTKAKEIHDLIKTNQGSPVIAPESDKRKAVNVSLDDFD